MNCIDLVKFIVSEVHSIIRLPLHAQNLSRKQALSQLTAHIERHGDVYDRTTSRQLWERKISKRLRWFMEMNLEEPKGLLKDILAAKRKIIISLPSTKQVDKRVWQR